MTIAHGDRIFQENCCEAEVRQLGEYKAKLYNSLVGLSRCRVSYKDMDGLEHSVEVDAETLYEAAALAVAEFRQDQINESSPGTMTEFTVTVFRKPTEHKIRLGQLQKWAEHTVREGPAGIVKRQRVRKLLGTKE